MKDRSYYVNHKVSFKLNLIHWALVIAALEDEYRNLPEGHLQKGTCLIIKRELEKQVGVLFSVVQ